VFHYRVSIRCNAFVIFAERLWNQVCVDTTGGVAGSFEDGLTAASGKGEAKPAVPGSAGGYHLKYVRYDIGGINDG
jgi:hypothetical protein